jgi:hypothetical protein
LGGDLIFAYWNAGASGRHRLPVTDVQAADGHSHIVDSDFQKHADLLSELFFVLDPSRSASDCTTETLRGCVPATRA